MNQKILCQAALPGSTAAVVIPSSPVKPELLSEGIRELERLGFKVKAPLDPARKWRYTAGEDDVRLAELRAALLDPEVNSVFCARGGYGLYRLLGRLEAPWFLAHPKVVVGCSDATFLLNYIVTFCGLPALHGPMPAQEIRHGESAYDARLLLALLGDPAPAGELRPEGVTALKPGSADGVLIGGCLSVLCSLIGTPFEPDPAGKILLLEDMGEKPYRIDRMLTTLGHAGWFDEVRGIVFGQMPDCAQHPDQGYSLEDVLIDRLQGVDVPVLFNFPAGHTRSVHLPLPLGVRVGIDAGRGSLTILEGMVR